MADYVNKNTDFSNLVITNDYPFIKSTDGFVYIRYNATDGKNYYYVGYNNTTTPYTVNGVAYSGPANISGTTLSVTAGATADNIVFIPSSTTTPTITNAGTITNSTIFNSKVTQTGTATSSGTDYVSCSVTAQSGSVSSSDGFYEMGKTSTTSGTLELSDGSSTTFQTSTGIGQFTTGNGTSTDASYKSITVTNPTFLGDASATVTSTSVFRLSGAFGNLAASKSTAYYRTSTNPSYISTRNGSSFTGYADWVATLGADNVTYYTTTTSTGATIKVTGPLTLINVRTLVINDGANVDGLLLVTTLRTGYATTTPTITIKDGGTLQNSQISFANVMNYGTSYNNNYFGQINYIGYTGSVSDYDSMYQGDVGAVTPLSVTQPVNDSTASVTNYLIGVTPPTSSVMLQSGSTFNSYLSVTPKVSFNTTTSTPQFTVIQAPDVIIESTDAITCFLTGTLIQTVNGLVAVENLNIGDQIITYQNNQQGVQPIIWVGYNNVKVKTYLPEDEAGYPVRIVKNAISDGVPASDLLVTPEHSIFFDGALIPVRMLVNGLNIFYDHSITEYTYYHFELEEHSIVSADNVLTESYLDTGNRSSFISNYNVVSIVNKKKEWNIDAAAPLVTNREVVEPIFMQLMERAIQLGCENITQDVLTINDSGLYLLTESGERLEATHQSNGRFIFKLPKSTIEVSLISKTSKPSRVIGPFVDDRRDLGVLVGAVTLLEKNHKFSIVEHLTSPELSGWDAQEQAACRWTNGNAKLTVRATPSQNAGMLVIQVLDTQLYLLEDKQKAS